MSAQTTLESPPERQRRAGPWALPERSAGLRRKTIRASRPEIATRATFSAVVLLGGKTATGIRVPPAVVARLAAGKRPPVRVTVGAHTYRSTVAVMGGAYMVPLSAENRSLARVAAGDHVDVRLELDTEPREVTVPADFALALAEEPDAQEFFDRLSYSQKRWFVDGIEAAKTVETRDRRIAKAVGMLCEGRRP